MFELQQHLDHFALSGLNELGAMLGRAYHSLEHAGDDAAVEERLVREQAARTSALTYVTSRGVPAVVKQANQVTARSRYGSAVVGTSEDCGRRLGPLTTRDLGPAGRTRHRRVRLTEVSMMCTASTSFRRRRCAAVHASASA